MRPLLVTARLGDRVVYSGDYLHLDGILSYGAYLAMSRAERAGLPDLAEDWAADMDLPLARWACDPVGDFDHRLLDDSGQLWGWSASVELGSWESQSQASYRKRPPLDRMVRYAKDATVQIGTGALKAYDLAFPAVFAREQHWRCVGDAAGVRELLSRVAAIGRKHNTGYGTVLEWLVEDDPSDALLPRVYPETIGVGMAGEHTRRPARIRPPYHHRSRLVTRCLVPVLEAP